MDILNLDDQISMLQSIGYTLTIDQKLRLKMAYGSVMSAHEHIDQLKFWGRIEGVTKNYYILIALKHRKAYEFPHKTFFYASSNDFQFKELPELVLQHQGLSQNFKGHLFSGDPNKILVNLEGEGQNAQGQPPAEEGQNAEGKQPKVEEDEDEDLKKAPKKNFTELHRLSYIVRAIDHDAHCVPRDSYRMTPQHELHPNRNFQGLNAGNCKLPGVWLHFRAPITADARKRIQEDTVIFSSDFLDGIQSDFPYGQWSTQVDSKGKNISLRSLVWPGYFAFHRLGSGLFGSAYIGEGIKNTDLPFMI